MSKVLAEVKRWHRPLMVMVSLMAALVVVCGIGLLVDDREILNESDVGLIAVSLAALAWWLRPPAAYHCASSQVNTAWSSKYGDIPGRIAIYH